jgi:outer membrane protein assembly factor BamB
MLTQERLKELLSYDPETGEFKWLVQISNRVPKGSLAGSLHHTGYHHIRIDKRCYSAHRLAWLYVKGVWPIACLDHKDTDKANNRFINLREATTRENALNVTLNSNNTSGYKGVSFDKATGKYKAYVGVAGKKKRLGSFVTAELASEAYQTYARTHHGEFYRP